MAVTHSRSEPDFALELPSKNVSMTVQTLRALVAGKAGVEVGAVDRFYYASSEYMEQGWPRWNGNSKWLHRVTKKYDLGRHAEELGWSHDAAEGNQVQYDGEIADDDELDSAIEAALAARGKCLSIHLHLRDDAPEPPPRPPPRRLRPVTTRIVIPGLAPPGEDQIGGGDMKWNARWGGANDYVENLQLAAYNGVTVLPP